jgi:hypothetical protein
VALDFKASVRTFSPKELLYLDFTGDEGISDVAPSLADDSVWRSVLSQFFGDRT